MHAPEPQKPPEADNCPLVAGQVITLLGLASTLAEGLAGWPPMGFFRAIALWAGKPTPDGQSHSYARELEHPQHQKQAMLDAGQNPCLAGFTIAGPIAFADGDRQFALGAHHDWECAGITVPWQTTGLRFIWLAIWLRRQKAPAI